MAARKNKKHPQKEGSIHVRLGSPKALRKDILALAISLIELLKRYEARIELRSHKENLKNLLEAELMEIKKLLKEFNIGELPLSVKQLENLPIIKEEKEAETMREREAKKIGRVIERHERVNRKEAMKTAEGRERLAAARKSKSVKRLEADLAALHEKLSKI